MKYITILLLLFSLTAVNAQGKLEKAKENLSSQSSSGGNKNGTKQVRTSSSNSNNSSNNFESTSLIEAFGELIFWSSLGATFGRADERNLTPYPYFDDTSGEYSKNIFESSKKSSFKLGVSHFLNTVRGFEFSGTYKFKPILGIEASHVHFYENRLAKATDFFDVTSLMANYYRVREKHITLWWGIGASYVSNGVKTLGFAYNLGTEIYPIKPISLHLSWKQSLINNSSVDVFKSNIKYHYKKAALVLGYNHFNLGGEKNVGVMLGLEYSF